jgi:integrase
MTLETRSRSNSGGSCARLTYDRFVYDLRHTAATLSMAAGVSVKVISDQLGHASISFTLERYSHVLPSIQDEAAAKVERMLMG